VLLREPLNPTVPALAQDIALPCLSVIDMIVLLKVDLIWAMPSAIFFFSRLLTLTVAVLRATQ
jgi:hypothetical protein